MKYRFGTIALMASIVLWGVLIGGGIYAAIVYFPAYLRQLPESAVVVNGPYGLNEGVFWLSLHPLLILSLIVSMVTNWRDPRRRKLIGASFAVYFIVLVFTQIYFLPELWAFHSSPTSGIAASEWAARAGRWQIFNSIRGLVLLASMIPLLFALTERKTANGDS